MKRKCPKCFIPASECLKIGFFKRKSDARVLQRYRCKSCARTFSQATWQLCYRQKKRRINPRVYELLCSGVSQRRIAKLLKINRITVVRKLLFLSGVARVENENVFKASSLCKEIQFDDLETIEHTKCKPLSLTLAVEKDSRRILAFHVSRMPAKGHLAKISRRKYGRRPDERPRGWDNMFSKLSIKDHSDLVIRSDENPHYRRFVKKWCPKASYQTAPGQRGSVSGQGELKKIGFDPLFSINHTFAMCRANINRLFRKTWCTTKRPDRLGCHLDLYVNYHNNVLI